MVGYWTQTGPKLLIIRKEWYCTAEVNCQCGTTRPIEYGVLGTLRGVTEKAVAINDDEILTYGQSDIINDFINAPIDPQSGNWDPNPCGN